MFSSLSQHARILMCMGGCSVLSQTSYFQQRSLLSVCSIELATGPVTATATAIDNYKLRQSVVLIGVFGIIIIYT